MVVPSRTMSWQALLTVGSQGLVLAPPGEQQEFLVPFQASAFGPDALGGDARPIAVEERGRALWTAACSGSLGWLLDRAAARANDAGAYLMLRIVPALDLQQGALQWLPWETLVNPARQEFLALQTGWSVVRGTADPFQEGRALPDGVPHVLVLVLGEQATQAEELESIETVFGGTGRVTVEPSSEASEVVSLLASTPAGILHVMGRGRGEGLLIGDGAAEDYLDGREVARAVARNPGIGLVVLSASASEVVAEIVARTADVTVLGHRDVVRAEHACRLNETFYQRLMDGMPADVALSEARRALDRRFPGQGAWATAVMLTSAEPPRLPVGSAPAQGNSRPPAEPSDPVITAAELIEQLHTMNHRRILDLREVAAWAPLDDQLAEVERALADQRPRRAP